MNWAALDFDWNHIRAFLATVEEGSLSAAARALGQSQPTLSRQIAALEEALGLTLFDRVGRGLVLAPAGRDLLAHVRAMGEAAQRLSLTAAGRSEAVEGLVSITASDTMSAWVLPPILTRLRTLAPGISIEVVAANDIRDLGRREADIALRHVRPEQPDLIARRLKDGHARFYAAPEYLDARGRPQSPADLAGHDIVGFRPVDRFVQQIGQFFEVPLTEAQVRYFTEDGIVAWELMREGLGIGIGMQATAALFPEVETVLPDRPAVTFPVWLTCHRELHTNRRIRLVYDMLAEALSSNAAR